MVALYLEVTQSISSLHSLQICSILMFEKGKLWSLKRKCFSIKIAAVH